MAKITIILANPYNTAPRTISARRGFGGRVGTCTLVLRVLFRLSTYLFRRLTLRINADERAFIRAYRKIHFYARGKTRKKVYRLINAVIPPTVNGLRRTALSYAAQATLAALWAGKATTLESLDSAFKFKFPFLQSRAFGMLFLSAARNRIWNSPEPSYNIIIISPLHEKNKRIFLFFIDKLTQIL